MAFPFLRPGSAPSSRSAHEIESFEAQLREVDSDLLRGVLTDTEADAARIELSRRLLNAAEEAERDADAGRTPPKLSTTIGIGAALGVTLIGTGVYNSIGSPGFNDLPLAQRDFNAERIASRPSQEQLELAFEKRGREAPPPSQARAQMLDLTEKVKERLSQKPDDAEGWSVLARGLMSLEIFDESWRAFEKVTELDPARADAGLYSNMTEAMYMAAGGIMSPQAEAVVDKALQKDPGFHHALFFKSIALVQRGKGREGIEGWIKMLETAPPDAPWIEQVQNNIREAATDIGVIPPANLVPKTDEQRATEEQAAMIEGMVNGLAKRLEIDPDDLEGWLMLIRSYRMLNREADAKAAQEKGLAIFEGDEAATAQLQEAL